jgi:hypothetical protein
MHCSDEGHHAWRIRIGRVIFATDSAEYDCSPLGTLFREIKYQLQLGFIEYHLELCSRLCNKLAYVPACIGAWENLLNHSVWLVDLPGDVAHAVADDFIVGTLFREIKCQLQLGFIEYHLEFCSRLCNKQMYVLACIGARENLLNQSV